MQRLTEAPPPARQASSCQEVTWRQSMETSDAMTVTVEFFGPFRAFGRMRVVALVGPVCYRELVNSLTADLGPEFAERAARKNTCLLYTSDAADDLLCVDLGGRRIIKKKK